jgi:hypothetical protein
VLRGHGAVFGDEPSAPAQQCAAPVATKLAAALSLSAIIGAVAVAIPALSPADNGCPNDLVPRNARPGDQVCVTKQVAGEIAQENANAANLREPNGGAYGPNTCKQGYVWREAFDGDAVCVVPQRRQETWSQNAGAGQGPTGGAPYATPSKQPPAAVSPGESRPPAPGGTTHNPTPSAPVPTTNKPMPSAPLPTTTFKPTPSAPVPTTNKQPTCDPRVDICVH